MRRLVNIIFKLEKPLKDEFSKVCKEMGVSMTDVMKASIIKFIEGSKTK